MRHASARARAMEWATGWSKVAAATARERPGAAVAVVAAVAVALPFLLVALLLAAMTFVVFALPLGVATAGWWVMKNRTDAEKKPDSSSTILSRLRAGTLRLSTLSEGSERLSEISTSRVSHVQQWYSGNPPVDLLVVFSGHNEFKMEGCDDAARLVARRICDTVENNVRADSNSVYTDNPLTCAMVDIETLCDVDTNYPGKTLGNLLADDCKNIVFVVESAVCLETPSDALRKFKRKLKSCSIDWSSTERGSVAPFTTVAITRSVGPEGNVWCGPKAGGKAGAEFDQEVDELLRGVNYLEDGSDATSPVPRLCVRCDAEIEHNGPGVIDRWSKEVLVPALSALPPIPPKILSLSSTHTALLTKHLNARSLVVGCDLWFHDPNDGDGKADNDGSDNNKNTKRIPRMDPRAPNFALIRELQPSLIVCAYDASVEALRELLPRWNLTQNPTHDSRRDSAYEEHCNTFSFEIVVLPCPLGRDCLKRSAQQIMELGVLARVDSAVAQNASDKLTTGLLKIRAAAEKTFGGERALIREVDENSGLTTPTPNQTKTLRPQPWVFIEADPELYSADSCTPLGAALAEGLGVGNIADPVWSDPKVEEKNDLSNRAAAALAKRMCVDTDAPADTSTPSTHYPQLCASRFWTPREPDWWIVAHPTANGTSATQKSFGDSLDLEDRERHAALRDGRVVTLPDNLCHAASQWTPDLVDVVEAVFQEMAKRADEMEQKVEVVEVVKEEEEQSKEVLPEVVPEVGHKEVPEVLPEVTIPEGTTVPEANGTSIVRSNTPVVLHDSFRDQNLRALPINALSVDLPLLKITRLDLSNNELRELPGLGCLKQTLLSLKLERNWFERVPPEVGELTNLEELDLSRNFVRPGDKSLALDSLCNLRHLKVIDLRWNRKVCTAEVLERMRRRLSGGSGEQLSITDSSVPEERDDSDSSDTNNLSVVDIRVTVSFPAPDGAFVGSSPADRNANTLRAQLEPWSTLALRRRLIEDFHEDPELVQDPEHVLRAEVMRRVLEKYEHEGLVTEKGMGQRNVVKVTGSPVSEENLSPLRTELESWLQQRTQGAKGNVQERPSIDAKAYMILRSPTDFNAKLGAGSRKARKAADKFAKFEGLWKCAQNALNAVDPDFAKQFTALAVTYGFQGSPHIDKQNVGPFYGLSIGDFENGTGGVCVEMNARTIAVVDTKHKLGKVDGRFPHWVGPWDSENKERFSLIYYRTMGDAEPITSAAFDADGVGVEVEDEGSE